MALNSRQKGAQGEREWSTWIRDNWGIEARRGCQHQGRPDAPDVITDLVGVHFEVKRVEKLSIEKAMAQATRDAGDGVPCIAHRRNRCDWMVTVKAKDVARFCKAFIDQKHWSVE